MARPRNATGYWVIPLCIAIGVGVLVVTHRGARRFLAWWRARRQASPALAFGESPSIARR